ncbi:S-layer family protein [Nostoc sp. FACHB-87]|uniref:two-partner secretion domain-containing protein n=1 Tax=Nostocaceae TaxID=1162 RepID=UPI0016855B6B|nr:MULTISPECIES: S-layer family protein [Nostocaceae]MBD2453805.1 S-layer family protein [Nostoc sp. FACHB-87]MBD2475239.1 S-layer family protein [Anabaena sp. FACHB-83]
MGLVNQVLLSSTLLPLGVLLLCNRPTLAQVKPDGTLKTHIDDSNPIEIEIKNGTAVGNNLFHSFSQFSIPSNVSVFFKTTSGIQNIFSRVTGNSISYIDGTINANANLFLLNPAGIIFGKNARLSIAGSFIGTTANTITFADGKEFSTDIAQTPVLTMSVPVGLQLGTNAGAIQVQGQLQVPTNQTLALVGSQINLTEARLRVPDGRVELWAVRNADIKIDNQAGWQLTSIANTPDWGTITLQTASSINTNGTNGGAINIRGRGLTLQDGSNIQSSTSGGQGKGIIVNTTDFVEILGASTSGRPRTSLGTSIGASSTGRAGDVVIKTGRLRITNGASLQSTTRGNNSRTGDIYIHTTDIELIGTNTIPNRNMISSTDINTVSSGTNNIGGNITIETNRLRTVDGGLISSDLFGGRLTATGKTGNIYIRATESFEIAGGTKSQSSLASGVTTSVQPSGVGQAGNIDIETGRLTVSNGGSIRSTLAGNGTAGNITIQATDVTISDPVIETFSGLVTGINTSVGKNVVGLGGTIDLTAENLRLFNGGQITSSTQGQGNAGGINLQVKNLDVQGISQPLSNGQILPSSITASSTTNFAAGSVNIQADTVRVRDNAQITVSNIGTGDAGNLNLNARQIFLDNGASLRSEVNGGSQGNIQLQVDEVLLLRHGSKISANASGNSTGGNININAPIIVGLENSDIIANAIQGRGGNIQITTQGIIGLEYRSQLTPENDITASSQFGVNGTVEVNNVGVDPNSGLVELPANLTDPSQQIANACDRNQGSSFVATGRGGIPQNPTQQVWSDRTWSDVRHISAFRKLGSINAQAPPLPQVMVQATSWRRNAQGQVELIAATFPTNTQPQLTCSALLQSSLTP